jgi:hypothetical protein
MMPSWKEIAALHIVISNRSAGHPDKPPRSNRHSTEIKQNSTSANRVVLGGKDIAGAWHAPRVSIGPRRSMWSRSAASNRTSKKILGAACWLFGAVTLFAQGPQIFKGAIIQNGATYVLSNATTSVTQQLDNQTLAKTFAARDVLVIGTPGPAASAIHVFDIVAATPPKVAQSKTVYIDCDSCVRDMAKARLAAFQELTAWKRFTVVPDPHKADLVFLFSQNPYLGDYVTRDGPDNRPVKIEITYMNVVDPKTGESLWSDSKELGSWFVGKATTDLVDEFREQLEIDQIPAERQLFLNRHRSVRVPPVIGSK